MKFHNIALVIGTCISLVSLGCGSDLHSDSIDRLVQLQQVENAYVNDTKTYVRYQLWDEPVYQTFKKIEKEMEKELLAIDREKPYIMKMYRRWEVLKNYVPKVRQAVIDRAGYKGPLLKELNEKLKPTDALVNKFLKEEMPN
jgi:hypothetical protein